jgi:hypothetical protein
LSATSEYDPHHDCKIASSNENAVDFLNNKRRLQTSKIYSLTPKHSDITSSTINQIPTPIHHKNLSYNAKSNVPNQIPSSNLQNLMHTSNYNASNHICGTANPSCSQVATNLIGKYHANNTDWVNNSKILPNSNIAHGTPNQNPTSNVNHNLGSQTFSSNHTQYLDIDSYQQPKENSRRRTRVKSATKI